MARESLALTAAKNDCFARGNLISMPGKHFPNENSENSQE